MELDAEPRLARSTVEGGIGGGHERRIGWVDRPLGRRHGPIEGEGCRTEAPYTADEANDQQQGDELGATAAGAERSVETSIWILAVRQST